MILSIDHIVLTITDLNKTVFFYSGVLDMKLVEFISSSDSTRRKSLKFGNQKINLHEAVNPFKPHAQKLQNQEPETFVLFQIRIY